jgi:hypothetical protein
MVVTSDVCLAVVYTLLVTAMVAFGAGTVAKLYWWAGCWVCSVCVVACACSCASKSDDEGMHICEGKLSRDVTHDARLRIRPQASCVVI